MKKRLLVLLFFIATNVAIGQTDSISMHYRSLSIMQPALLQSLNFQNKNNYNKELFSKSAFEESLPKQKTTAIFCVIENQILGTSKIPIRMRLGSLDYTNSLEGKNPFDLELNNTLTIPK